jgi:hypothetical protein
MTDDRYAKYGAPPETEPPRDPVQEWRDKQAKWKAERVAEARVREAAEAKQKLEAQYGSSLEPVLAGIARTIAREVDAVRREINAIAQATDNEIDAVKRQLRQEILAARRHNKRRKKKLTQAEIDRRAEKHVMRQRGLPPEVFE